MKFSTAWDCDYWMNSNGFYAGFNMPEALISREDKDEELAHRLPPYAKRKSFMVDEFPACPSNWMQSEGKLTSYFVPVQEKKGMWLDFNKNFERDYHVAIVVSVQGVNPITGLPCKDAALEQYIESCPKCNEKFGPNRLCKKCGYKWPKQNYICTTGTPSGQLWLDGFRSAEGVVRQYILTQEKMRGVASNIIGESRVFAIGMSFFLSKNPKRDYNSRYQDYIRGSFNKSCLYLNVSSPAPEANACGAASIVDKSTNTVSDWMETPDRNLSTICDSLSSFSNTDNDCVKSSSSNSRSVKSSNRSKGGGASAGSFTSQIKTKKLEVGAGANIDQMVYDDPETLDFWRTSPESILCVNYCLEEEAAKIITSGRVSVAGHKEGFLKDVLVGNK